jgi:hypothetical protein
VVKNTGGESYVGGRDGGWNVEERDNVEREKRERARF